MKNHFIIGLGGTGGKIIASYRQHLTEKFGSIHSTGSSNIEYLWVDSSQDDMDKVGEMWTAKGQDISLGEQQKLLIQSSGLRDAVGEPVDPHLKPWIGSVKDWGHLTSSENDLFTAGGQIRRLGRFNFTNFVHDFNTYVTRGMNKLQVNSSDSKVFIHLVAGMAGGTGSGAFIDAAAQILKAYPGQVRLCLYLVSPEKNPDPSHLGKYGKISFYHANGYAALKELNGFMTGDFAPYDIASQEDHPEMLQKVSRPDNIFLFTEESMQGQIVSGPVLRKKIANVLYLNTVAFDSEKSGSSEIDDALERIISGENKVVPPDLNWGLSNKMTGISTQSLTIPKKEIETYLGYELVLSAINKAMANKFVINEGYVDEEYLDDQNVYAKERKSEFASLINELRKTRKSVLLQEWFLTTEYLTLDRCIPNSDFADFKEFKIEFKDKVNRFYNALSQTLTHNGTQIKEREILRFLHADMIGYFNKGFRNEGVSNFFQRMMRDVNVNQVVEKTMENLRSYIYRSDMSSKAGEFCSFYNYRSLLEFIRDEFFDILKDYFHEELTNSKKRINLLEKSLENEKTDYVNSFGLIAKKSKREKAIQSFTNDVVFYCVEQCKKEGYSFGIHLIGRLTTAFNEEIDVFTKTVDSIGKIRSQFNKEYLELREKVTDDYHDDSEFSCANGKSFDDFQKVLKEDRGSFDNILKSTEQMLYDTLPDLQKGRDIESIVESLKLNSVTQSINQLNEKLDSSGQSGKLVDNFYNVHILDLLIEKYNGNVKNPDFQKILDQLVLSSAPMMKFIQGKGTAPSLFAILPAYDEEVSKDQSRGRFIDDLKKELRARGIKPEEGDFTDEIMVVQSASQISFETVQRIKDLKKEYDIIKNRRDNSNAQFLLHLQKYESLVDLKQPDYTEFAKAIHPYMMLIDSADGFDHKDDELAIQKRDDAGVKIEGDSVDLYIKAIDDILDPENCKEFYRSRSFFMIRDRYSEVKKKASKEQVEKQVIDKLKEFEAEGVDPSDVAYSIYRNTYSVIKSL